MKKIMMVWVSALILFFSADVRSEIKTCVGPDGSVQYVNTECPDGYRIEGSMPSSRPASAGEDEEPYICRFADIIEAVEIESALAEAEGSLIRARENADREAEGFWAKCLGDLKRRQEKLQSPLEVPHTGPAVCTEGEFEYKEGGIYFNNNRRGACQGVRALCTFDVSRSQRAVRSGGGRIVDRGRGDVYTTTTTQEVREITYRDRIGKFDSARVGDVDITGRITGWRCRLVN